MHLRSEAMPIDKSPVDLETKAGLAAEVQMTVAQHRELVEKSKRQRIGFRPAMRLDPEDTARRSKREMAMQFGSGVRGEHDPVLLGKPSNAQSFSEAGGAGCVELHVTDPALYNKIAHREARQFSLAMRQGDRRRRR